jgi:hypothetical protein
MAKKRNTRKKQSSKPRATLTERASRWPAVFCSVNPNWKETGMASVCLVRASSRGDLALGGFMAELGCRGIKDAFVRDIGPEALEDLRQNSGQIEVDAAVGFAIVKSASEWGARWGFMGGSTWKKHADFWSGIAPNTSVEVTLGRDGKPFYMASPNDVSPGRILAKLRESAGPDGYHFVIGEGISPALATELLMGESGHARILENLQAELMQTIESGAKVDSEQVLATMTEKLAELMGAHLTDSAAAGLDD